MLLYFRVKKLSHLVIILENLNKMLWKVILWPQLWNEWLYRFEVLSQNNLYTAQLHAEVDGDVFLQYLRYLIMNLYCQNIYKRIDGKLYILRRTFIESFSLFSHENLFYYFESLQPLQVTYVNT